MSNFEVRLQPLKKIDLSDIKEDIPLNISSIGTTEKWRQGYRGKGIVVAILDTGCETQHPDLKERIIDGYNFTEEHNGDIGIYEDLNGHGTHVAGIVGGSINNIGIVGMAPGTSLLILKVLNRQGRGSVDSLIEAINYAIDWRGVDGESVRVISLSLGMKNSNKYLYSAVKRAIKHNISVVSASGNDGDGDMDTYEYRYPGAYQEVIEVGAIDDQNNIAHFSNTNEYVDLHAPGVGIYSTFLEKGYSQISGTSMAAPHVSGAIALLIEEYEYLLARRLTEKEIYRILMKHTSMIYKDEFRYIKVINLNGLTKKNKVRLLMLREKNRDMLLKCFCEARRTQAFFTKCLDEDSTDEEREFLIDLIQESATTTKKIKDFCGYS